MLRISQTGQRPAVAQDCSFFSTVADGKNLTMTSRGGDREEGNHVWHRFFRKTLAFQKFLELLCAGKWEKGWVKAPKVKHINEETIGNYSE